MKVSVAEAKNTLPKLIKAVEDGESVTIYRHGTGIVDIVRTTKPDSNKPKFGTLKGTVTAYDPDWCKPMIDEEVDALVDGRQRCGSSSIPPRSSGRSVLRKTSPGLCGGVRASKGGSGARGQRRSLTEIAVKQTRGKLSFGKASVMAGVADLRLRVTSQLSRRTKRSTFFEGLKVVW